MGENMSIVIQRKFPNTCKKLDFYILEIPFLRTSKLEVNINDGTFSIEVDVVTLIFNIFKAMRHLTNDDSILYINLIDLLMQYILNQIAKLNLMLILKCKIARRVRCKLKNQKSYNWNMQR